MNNIPDFTEQEIQTIHTVLTKRYKQTVDLQLADSEVRLDPATPSVTLCPTVYWEVNQVSLVVLKTAPTRYRCQFFYPDLEPYGTGISEYDDLAKCVLSLLQVQADHDLNKNLYG